MTSRRTDQSKQDGASSNGDGKVQRKEHIELTRDQTREPGATILASIQSIKQLSPTIKGFTLRASPLSGHLSFKAGQWVDFFIPGMDKIGGFSMCSDPEKLKEKNILELAIKFSTWPPAFWLHTKAEIGSQVTMRVGGDYHYPNAVTNAVKEQHNLLLIAGGVGINPLASILLHVCGGGGGGGGETAAADKVRLLYSASARNELIFRQDFDRISREKETNQFQARYFVTRENLGQSSKDNVIEGRLDSTHLKEALIELSDKPTFCYICGPTPMIQSLEAQLTSLGMNKEHIFYELWW